MVEGWFEIREARSEEYESLGEIGALAYGALEGESDLGYLDEVRDVVTRAGSVPILAAVDANGTLLGSVTYVPGPGNQYSELERPDEAGFRMLAVAPWAQGRGVGRGLVEAVLARARAEGRAGVAIYTRPVMRAAQHLYGTLGFAGADAGDWEFEPGEWLWAYRLRF